MSNVFEFGEILADGDLLVDLRSFDGDISAGELGALLGITAKEVLYALITNPENWTARRSLYRAKEDAWRDSDTYLDLYLTPLRLRPFEQIEDEDMWIELRIRIEVDPDEDPIEGWLLPRQPLHMPFSRVFADTMVLLTQVGPKVTRKFTKTNEEALLQDIEDIESNVRKFCKARDQEARVLAECQQAMASLQMAISVVELQMDLFGLDYSDLREQPKYAGRSWSTLLTSLYELQDKAAVALLDDYRTTFSLDCKLIEQAMAVGELAGYLENPNLERRIELLLQHPGEVSSRMFERVFTALSDAVCVVGSDPSGERAVERLLKSAAFEFLQYEPPDLWEAAEAAADPQMKEFLLDGWQDAFGPEPSPARGVLKAIATYGGGHRAAMGVMTSVMQVLAPHLVTPLAKVIASDGNRDALKKVSSALLRFLIGVEGPLHLSKTDRYASVLLSGLSPDKALRIQRIKAEKLERWFLRGEITGSLLFIINTACLYYALVDDSKSRLEHVVDVAAALARSGSDIAAALRVLKPFSKAAATSMQTFGRAASIYAFVSSISQGTRALGRGDGTRTAIHYTAALGSGVTTAEWLLGLRVAAVAAPVGPALLIASAVISAAAVVMSLTMETSGPADTFDAYYRDAFLESPGVELVKGQLDHQLGRVDAILGPAPVGQRGEFQDEFDDGGGLINWHLAVERGFSAQAIAAMFKAEQAGVQLYIDEVLVP